MYRKLTSNSNQAIANVLGLKFLLRDYSEIAQKQFTKLSQDEVNQLLIIQELDENWNLNVNSLSRKYQFLKFQDSFSFMSQISQIADQMKHYPKWFNKNGLVQMDLMSPEAQGVTFKDVILAHSAEHIAQVIMSQPKTSIFDNCDIHLENLISSWNNNYQRIQGLNHVFERSVNYI
ncbi:unnamed protein product (macronuclear) [Paramecium tetraurelia]|uniref:4a-hydroxytetrahydrobiopterin dehydratase n=1 Tax=Paramecium tetraurelia TaxID=5888 RepID=A0CE78_PARTE|nr:uncharacterized protein GSPATT00037531001 [Paramecium tetraurelia]CAK69095.1 unnamed protein product [Paramecium tetraurelia]|eukprot:XP_001436492.1 hypothetical protein (macronuclear) [Paramecium tetraurelia strain d4-2]